MPEFKTLPTRMDDYLWHDGQFHMFRRCGQTANFITFKQMQVIRVIMIVLLLAELMASLYIDPRKFFMYFTNWGALLTPVAIMLLFHTAGRHQLED
jgi:hypothetical protein